LEEHRLFWQCPNNTNPMTRFNRIGATIWRKRKTSFDSITQEHLNGFQKDFQTMNNKTDLAMDVFGVVSLAMILFVAADIFWEIVT